MKAIQLEAEVMIEKPIISVIIPVYNAEKYLDRCINSLRKQTFSDFEVVLVDDGSTDESYKKCTTYMDEKFTVRLVHEENQGLCAARNLGVQIAIGNYVTFVDADDFVSPFYLEYLYRALMENNADFAMARPDRRRSNDTGADAQEPVYRAETMNKEEALSEILCSHKSTVSSWNKMAKREMYLQHPFPIGMKYEDLYLICELVLSCERIACVDAVLYHYVMTPGSITGLKKVTMAQLLDYKKACNHCEKLAIEYSAKLKPDVCVLLARDYMSLYLSARRCEDDTRKIQEEIVQWFSQNWKPAVCNPKASKTVRLRILLMRISPALYQAFYYIAIVLRGKALG